MLVDEVLDLALLAGQPAGLCEGAGLEHDLQLVFIGQAVGHDLELQLAHSADDEIGAKLGTEQLGHALFSQSLKRLLQVLGLERVLDPHPLQDSRGEVGQAGEPHQAGF